MELRGRTRLGIDLGGTKIEVVALDAEGRELARRRVPTPAGDYEATLHAIVALVGEVEIELDARGDLVAAKAGPDGASGLRGAKPSIGIGTPGSVSRVTGRLRGSNSICLNGKAIRADLERLLRRSVRIENDATCFTLSETRDGAGRSADVVFGVILGTGVGGGLCVGGRALAGPNGIAGEWGHNPLPWSESGDLPLPRCWCGLEGCIETYLSGPGFAADHRGRGGGESEAPAIVARALDGDALALRSLERYEHRLARALAHVVNIVDPDVIVLGGGMSNVERLYRNVPQLWSRWVFSDRVDTRLVRNVHGDSSGVRGAAWLGAADGEGLANR